MHAEDLDPRASPPRTLQAMTYPCRIYLPPEVREGFSHCLGESLFLPRKRPLQREGALSTNGLRFLASTQESIWGAVRKVQMGVLPLTM